MNWSGWSEVPGNGTTDVALNAAGNGDAVYLVGKGIDDHRVYVNTFLGSKNSWTGWAEVPGGLTTDSSPSVEAVLGGLFIVARGTRSRIYSISRDLSGKWSGWSEVPGGSYTDVSVDAFAADSLYLFAKGIVDSRVYVNRTNSTPGAPPWTGWTQVPGGGTTDAALSACLGSLSRQLWLFAKGINDNRIYRIALDLDNHAWFSWTEVPGGGTTDVALSAVEFGGVYLFAKGIADQKIYMNACPLFQSQWSGWQEVPGGGTTDVSLASAQGPGQRIFLFAKGINDRRIYVNIAT